MVFSSSGAANGLLNERRVRIQRPPRSENVLAVTGHEQHRDSRVHLLNALRQFRAGDLGHHQVGQQHVEMMIGGKRQCFRAGGRLEYRVSVTAQDPGGDLPDGRLVLDHEDRLAAAPGGLGSGRRGGRHGVLVRGREEGAEGRAHARLGVDAEAATGPGHDAVHGCQPQPGSLVLRLGGEERLEDPGDDLGRPADPGVADRQLHVVAGCDRGMQARVFRHRVTCVDREVDHHLFHLAPVRADQPR